VSDVLFRSLVGHADANELGLHLHCLESPVQAAVCRRLYPQGTLRHLAELGVLGPRTVLAHGVHLTDEDIRIAAEHGVIIAHNPGSNLRLCNGVAPIGRLLAAGIRVALGTDNTALLDDEDLLAELKLMAGLARDPKNGGSPLGAPALLEAVTTAAAAAAQQPDRLGRIAKGLPADLVALDTAAMGGAYLDAAIDPLEPLAARARGRDVRLTIVAGRLLYREGHFPHLDMIEVETAARQAASSAKRPADSTLPEITAALAPALAQLYRPLVSPGIGP
jgi:cytosine/adenosine deaminase-related metal-dependent hydrolase